MTVSVVTMSILFVAAIALSRMNALRDALTRIVQAATGRLRWKMKAEALRCDYCSGFVDPKTYRCPYCGTQYIKPREEPFGRPLEMKLIAVNAPVDVYGVQTTISAYDIKMMNDIGVPIEQEVRRDMARQLADIIAEKIDIVEDYDIRRMDKTYSARLRVVKPDFRF